MANQTPVIQGSVPTDSLALLKDGVRQMEAGLKSLKSTSEESNARGLSLHIGINKLNPKCYPTDADDLEGSGWEGELNACEWDAQDMQKIADSQGFESTILLTSDATVENVTNAIRNAANTLTAGDSFFITYSGHGGRVEDVSGDEKDGPEDQTWCLYDRQFIDDELAVLYTEFEAGVRILVLSDSCHSGTVTRSMPRLEPALTPEESLKIFGMEKPVFRLMTRETANAVYYARWEFYDEIQNNTKQVRRKDIKASMRLISACQDDEIAADGMKNGKFTSVVKEVWDNGNFEGGCRKFHKKINKRLKKEYARAMKGRSKAEIKEMVIQKPNYNTEGPKDAGFDKKRPFSI